MRAFLRKCALYLLPLLAGLIYLFVGHYDKHYGYHYMFKNCSDKSDWLYNRIFINHNNIDIAFIGSSKTMCGINDSLIESKLIRDHQKHLNIANLGFCRLGRTLHYALTKDILRNHKPKAIIIEVGIREDRFSHDDFPFIADSRDVLFPVFLFNQNYFNDLFSAIESRLSFNKEKVLAIPQESSSNFSSHHRFKASPIAADSIILEEAKQKRTNKFNKRQTGILEEISSYVTYRFPKKYLEKIHSMVQQKNIQLYFFYLPGFGEPAFRPTEFAYYDKLGTVIIPPERILATRQNWADSDHLNAQGADELSVFLVSTLDSLINNQE